MGSVSQLCPCSCAFLWKEREVGRKMAEWQGVQQNSGSVLVLSLGASDLDGSSVVSLDAVRAAAA